MPTITLNGYEDAYASQEHDALRSPSSPLEHTNTYFGSVPAAALRKRCLICLNCFVYRMLAVCWQWCGWHRCSMCEYFTLEFSQQVRNVCRVAQSADFLHDSVADAHGGFESTLGRFTAQGGRVRKSLT
jgi:hypothetical protein